MRCKEREDCELSEGLTNKIGDQPIADRMTVVFMNQNCREGTRQNYMKFLSASIALVRLLSRVCYTL